MKILHKIIIELVTTMEVTDIHAAIVLLTEGSESLNFRVERLDQAPFTGDSHIIMEEDLNGKRININTTLANLGLTREEVLGMICVRGSLEHTIKMAICRQGRPRMKYRKKKTSHTGPRKRRYDRRLVMEIVQRIGVDGKARSRERVNIEATLSNLGITAEELERRIIKGGSIYQLVKMAIAGRALARRKAEKRAQEIMRSVP